MTKNQLPIKKLNILIIEDNHGDFILIEEYLLEKFTDIHIAHYTDFAQSVDYLKNTHERPNVILLDLNLPDKKGIALVTDILEYNYEAPVIVLTGYSDLGMAEQSLQMGASDYLLKDEINPVILHKTIIFALNRSNYIQQIEHEKTNYEKLFDFNPQPTWLLDAKSLKILTANIAAQKKYGYSLSDFQQMSFMALHPEEEQLLIKHKLSLNTEETITIHFTHILADGKEIKVDIYFQELTTGENLKLIVQSNDISKSLDHINTIENQNIILRDIAWTQSHVVRAPVSRILGIVNLLVEHPTNFDEITLWLKRLKISADELDQVVRKIVSETNQFEKD